MTLHQMSLRVLYTDDRICRTIGSAVANLSSDLAGWRQPSRVDRGAPPPKAPAGLNVARKNAGRLQHRTSCTSAASPARDAVTVKASASTTATARRIRGP